MLYLLGPDAEEDPDEYKCTTEIYPSEIESFAIELEKTFESKISNDLNVFELLFEMDLQQFSNEEEAEMPVLASFNIYEYRTSWSLMDACRSVELLGEKRFLVEEGRAKLLDLIEESIERHGIATIGDEIVREGFDDGGDRFTDTKNWLGDVFQEIEINGRALEIECTHD